MSSITESKSPLSPLKEHKIIDSTEVQKENPKTKSKDDIIGIFILIALYTIQGIPMSFFGRTISVLFLEHGAHSSNLATLSLASMPYSFKFLIAPFVDTHYFKFLGKRKSYIVPMQYLLEKFSIICFALSYALADKIKTLDVTTGLLFGFTSMFIMAVQDIAVDGWVITILSPENRPYGSLAQTLGLTFGGIIGFNIFIPLNSIMFCNSFINHIPKDDPVLTTESFWRYIGFSTLIVTILIHVFKKEKRQDPHEEKTSVWEVVKALKTFVTNPNLRQLVLTIITGYITIAPVYTLFDTKLILKGFPKETLTNIASALIPFQMLASVLLTRLCKKKIEMKIKFWCSVVAHFNCFFLLWVVDTFDINTNYTATIIYVVIGNSVVLVTFYGHFISNGSFANRICDESIGGTFLTTLAALTNIGFMIPESLSFYIEGYMRWEYMSLITLVVGPFYLLWYRKQTIALGAKTPEDFSSSSVKKD